ncbi:unnamed protein product [Effrenium voratum]|nr:unnamed protein product [Effrenium voratum]
MRLWWLLPISADALPLALEHEKAASFANASALACAWENYQRKAKRVGHWSPRSKLAVADGFGFQEAFSELPSTGSAIALYAAHDSSIAISLDGRILCVLELERLFGVRYFWPPLEASRGIWLQALHAVRQRCSCESLPASFDYGAVVLFSGDPFTDRLEYSRLPLIVQEVFAVRQWRLVDHHEAHARMGFYSSPFTSAMVVSYDGGGNDGVFNVYLGQGKRLFRLGKLGVDMGVRYKTLGAMMIDDLTWAGKLMAYAALGSSQAHLEELVAWYYRSPEGAHRMPAGLVRACCESLEGQRAVAVAAQAQFESYALHLVRELLGELSDLGLSQPEGLVLTGGCALNVLANQRIEDFLDALEQPMALYVPAAPNDSGLTVGGVWSMVPPQGRQGSQALQYVGFKLWDEDGLEAAAAAWGAVPLSSVGGVDYLAQLLVRPERPVVAVVRGRQEFGPRALGHRSLLAVPDSLEMKDRMNRLKARQWFRPVAPMIAEEALPEVFGRPARSPYMSMAPRVREEVLGKFPALAHLDGTARHQSVSQQDEPWLHSLLTAVGKHIGLAVLLNTSFNSKGKPIANSVKECLEMLTQLGDLDFVLIEDWLFAKPS